MVKTHELVLQILAKNPTGATCKEIYLAMEPSEQGLYTGGANGVSKVINSLQTKPEPLIKKTGTIQQGSMPATVFEITNAGLKAIDAQVIDNQDIGEQIKPANLTIPTMSEMIDGFERSASELMSGFNHITQAFKLTLQELEEVKAELGAQTSPSDLFSIGDTVSKVGGDYSFDGKIVTVFKKLSGAVRLVVEDERGILHIYNEKNLEKR